MFYNSYMPVCFHDYLFKMQKYYYIVSRPSASALYLAEKK